MSGNYVCPGCGSPSPDYHIWAGSGRCPKMNGIAEILSTGRFPGFIVSSGKTEQRKCEDESARNLLKGCREFEDRHGSGFMRGSGMSATTVKEVWNTELADSRRNSITERYDDRMARIEEIAEKTGIE